MRHSLHYISILFFISFQTTYSQELDSAKNPGKGRLMVEPSVELIYRNFGKESFLRDAYQANPGYHLRMNARVGGYPGIGLYTLRQNASVVANGFLGGFFEDAKFIENGVFIYHTFYIHRRFMVSPEIGFGLFRVIHGESPSRFILNYNRVFGGLGLAYVLIKDKHGVYDVNLTLRGGYGGLNGREIVINQSDRSYVRRSTDLQTSLGIQISFH